MLLHFIRPYTSLEERIILWLSGKAAAKTLLRWVWIEAEAMKVPGRVLSQSKSESFVPYAKIIAEGGILPHTLFLADTQNTGINLEMHQSVTHSVQSFTSWDRRQNVTS